MMLFFANLVPMMFAGPANCPGGSSGFLGFPTWYHYLPPQDFNGCEIIKFNFLPSDGSSFDLLLVILAVVDILLRIAGIIAFIYTLYGGFQYLTSQGEPEKIKHAQGTITNALIGLAIALVGVTGVSFIGHAIG